jgi:hypothetical protein
MFEESRQADTNRLSALTFIIFISLLAVLTLLVILSCQVPVFQSLPFWFYPLQTITVNPSYLGFCALALGIALVIINLRCKVFLKLLVLVIIGSAIQYGLAFSKNRGLDGLRDRMVSSGHAEFADVAVRTNPKDVIFNYQQLASNGEIGMYPNSKPPGTLLLYMVFDRVANYFLPDSTRPRAEILRDFAALTWPVFSMLPIVLIFYLSALMMGRFYSLLASFLWTTIPAVNLITLHADQAFFPLLGLSFALCFTAGLKRDKLELFFLSGVLLGFAAFFSFGILVLGIWSLSFLWLTNFSVQRKIRSTLFFLSGVVFFASVIWLSLGYDFVGGYAYAKNFHLEWKGWDGSFETYIKAALTNLIEYTVWTGAPVIVLFLYAFVTAVSALCASKPRSWVGNSTIALSVTVLFLLVFGATKAETARLWLFLTPLVIISSVSTLAELSHGSMRKCQTALILIAAMQFAACTSILKYQDFF